MAKKKTSRPGRTTPAAAAPVTATTDELQLASLERGGDASKTGRILITFKQGALDAGVRELRRRNARVMSARDFHDQAVDFAQAGDADVIMFPEIGVALVGGEAADALGLVEATALESDSAVDSIDPEYFMFATAINPSDYLKGALRVLQGIYADLGESGPGVCDDVSAQVLGVTPGLMSCRVPSSAFDGSGIRVAILDTGFDLGHPEFAGRAFVSQSFVTQAVRDLNGHGTHTTGTACGPQAPAGNVPRYGIAFRSQIYVGKVLTNSGSGTQAQVLAGMNWAIANRCQVISMSLGAQIAVQPSYTAAGTAALNAGGLIIAAAGNASTRPGVIGATGAPANSPSIMSVAALDASLRVAVFSNGGKIDIAAPGVNVYSSWLRPTLHNTISGTSMATPHVSGCAALWAQSNSALRGAALRTRLQAAARALPLPASDVGAGLVQAP